MIRAGSVYGREIDGVVITYVVTRATPEFVEFKAFYGRRTDSYMTAGSRSPAAFLAMVHGDDEAVAA